MCHNCFKDRERPQSNHVTCEICENDLYFTDYLGWAISLDPDFPGKRKAPKAVEAVDGNIYSNGI